MGAKISRESLPPGVWDEDINRYPNGEYPFEHCGYQCKLVRKLHSWTWCGYVTLPETHPDFSTSYEDLGVHFNVHGGLTFGEDGTFGFDTSHLGDIIPSQFVNIQRVIVEACEAGEAIKRVMNKDDSRHYWTYEEVEKELKSLAEQFKKRETLPKPTPANC